MKKTFLVINYLDLNTQKLRFVYMLHEECVGEVKSDLMDSAGNLRKQQK